MARTIYEASPGALTATGDRTVSTFPSGLCRVDQTYACPSAYAATHRATLAIGSAPPDSNTAPAIDGLYIFPAPEEIQKPDGFTEFRVSTYGRVATGLQGIELSQQTHKSGAVNFLTWKISGQICLPSGSALDIDDLDINEELLLPFGFTYANPTYKVLSVAEVDTTTSSWYWGHFRINGKSVQFKIYPVLPKRQYEIEYTYDGFTPLGKHRVWVHDPKIIITGSRSFGEFVEIEITTERENTTAEVV